MVGHARPGAAVGVIDPLLGQIQTIGERQAGMIVGGQGCSTLTNSGE